MEPEGINRAGFRGVFNPLLIQTHSVGRTGHRKRPLRAEWSGMAVCPAAAGSWISSLVVKRQSGQRASQRKSAETGTKAALSGTTRRQAMLNWVRTRKR